MKSGQPAVLAFTIRHRETPTGRAETTSISLRLRSLVNRSTPSIIPISSVEPMTKRQTKIDMRNPFIPASSPACRVADTVLLFSVSLFGLAAAVAAILRQVF